MKQLKVKDLENKELLEDTIMYLYQVFPTVQEADDTKMRMIYFSNGLRIVNKQLLTDDFSNLLDIYQSFSETDQDFLVELGFINQFNTIELYVVTENNTQYLFAVLEFNEQFNNGISDLQENLVKLVKVNYTNLGKNFDIKEVPVVFATYLEDGTIQYNNIELS